MNMSLRAMIALLAAAALTACSASLPKLSLPKLKIPRMHKVLVQQGNVIEQDMIDGLKPGMTRAQVAFVMGQPIAPNTFNRDRWDYIYTLDLPGVRQEEKRISLHFKDDELAYFTGDYLPSGEQPE